MTNTLYVKGYSTYAYDPINTQIAALIYFSTPAYLNSQPLSGLAIEFTTGTEDPFATPYPLFHSIDSAINYYGPSKCAQLISNINTLAGTAYYTAYDLERVDPPIQAALDALSTVAHTGVYSDLSGKPTIPSFTPGSHIANGATNAATNAVTNLPTNFNLVSGILGVANGLNDANSAQNDLAAKYNTLAADYNDLATKVNTLLSNLTAQGLQS